jgi:hypothetical protein
MKVWQPVQTLASGSWLAMLSWQVMQEARSARTVELWTLWQLAQSEWPRLWGLSAIRWRPGSFRLSWQLVHAVEAATAPPWGS